MLGNAKYALEVARALIIKEISLQDVNVKDDVKSGVLCPFTAMPWHFNASSRSLTYTSCSLISLLKEENALRTKNFIGVLNCCIPLKLKIENRVLTRRYNQITGEVQRFTRVYHK